jgi:nucleotide-binding universal stress UspA family protein
MRVLCAIGQRGGAAIIERVAAVVGGSPELLLLEVIDTGPRHGLERLIGPLRHGPLGGHEREDALTAAEDNASRAALGEAEEAARAAGLHLRALVERGRPEQIIVRVAEDEGVSLIAIEAHEGAEGHPSVGPASVGHTARFVLDHAPCDVLLLRQTR